MESRRFPQHCCEATEAQDQQHHVQFSVPCLSSSSMFQEAHEKVVVRHFSSVALYFSPSPRELLLLLLFVASRTAKAVVEVDVVVKQCSSSSSSSS